MHKILVVVDDRVVTQSAIQQAIEIAQALRADIHFFCVLPRLVAPGFGIQPVAQLSNNDAQNEATAQAKNLLMAASATAERAGIQSFRGMGFASDGAQCVSKAAEKRRCDMIVIGEDCGDSELQIPHENILPRLLSIAPAPVLVCRGTGSGGKFGLRGSLPVPTRRLDVEYLERRRHEKND